MSKMCEAPDFGNWPAMRAASAFAHSTPTVGPEPESHAHQASVANAAMNASCEFVEAAKRTS